jgi:hypothetical protein
VVDQGHGSVVFQKQGSILVLQKLHNVGETVIITRAQRKGAKEFPKTQKCKLASKYSS